MSQENNRGPLGGFRLSPVAALAAALVALPLAAQEGAFDAPLSEPVPIDASGAPAPVDTIPVQPIREEAAELEEIEVTGSRIRGVDLEKSQPIISIDRGDIERSGLTSLGDALSQLSVAGSALNTNVNNGGVGSVFVDLRSLGPQRTLVLVNGRRWVNDAGALGGSVDFSTIPISIVERIEVLKDGASALYGSDAIAGVINVITRKDITGATVSSQVGEFAEGDGRIQSHSLTVGSVGGKTSALLDLSYTKSEPVFAGDRDMTAVPVFGAPANDTRVGASSTNPCGRYLGVGAAGDNGLTLDRSAGNRQDCSGAASGTPAGFEDFNPQTDGYNFAPINYLVTPSERIGFYGALRQEVLFDINFQADALYQNRKSAQVLAETPLVLGPALGDDTVIAANNPYNPFGEAIGDEADEGVQRRLVEAAGRRFEQDVQTYHLGAGFNSTFEAFGRIFDWDIGYIYNQSVNQATTTGQVNLDRVQQAVGDPANCTGLEQPDPCVPLNLFGAPGSITPAMLNYILVTEQSRLEQEVRGYTANISTPELFQLPAGGLGVAVGFEHRREAGADTPDALVNSGATSGNARKPTQGGYSLVEFYGEARVPVLREFPFVNSLDVTLATRHSQYDIQGRTKDVTKSKAGVEYRPIEELLVRASFAEGFRAPSITELFGGRGDSFPQLTDPCAQGAEAGDGEGFEDLSAEQQANCVASGTPATGAVPQANSQIKTTVGGEPSLEPEEAESIILGAVYSPDFLPGATLTIDIYNYKLDNAISALDAQGVLDGCANTGSAFYCDRISRNAQTGSVDGLIATNVNIGGAEISGLDAHLSYKLPELFDGRYGSFGIELDMTFLDKYEQYVLDDSTGGTRPQELAGRLTGDITTVGGLSLPEVKANGSLEWIYGQWGASYTLRYIGEMTENCANLRRAPELADQLCYMGQNQDGDAAYQHDVDAMFYHDIQASYELPAYNAKVAFGINNVLDDDPPVSYSVFANSYDARTYDVPGMFPYLRGTISFE